MCAFNDETYYYPRYGYATQLQNYLIDNANEAERRLINGKTTL